MQPDNRASWNVANNWFAQYKGDYSQAIRSHIAVLPDEIVGALSLHSSDTVLHLMCNDGREAAYLTAHTGCHVVGVDFSDPAIEHACQLNRDLGFHNAFVLGEVYSWLTESTTQKFTRVLLTLGSLRWIPDLSTLWHLVRCVLAPDGFLAIWDFHPILSCLDGRRVFANDYPFASRTRLRECGVVDYVNSIGGYRLLARRSSPSQQDYVNPHRVLFSEHSLAVTVNTAIAAGFRLKSLHEFDFSWEECCAPWLVESSRARFVAGPGAPKVPLTFLLSFVG